MQLTAFLALSDNALPLSYLSLRHSFPAKQRIRRISTRQIPRLPVAWT